MDISEFKAQNPAYKDVPDLELADALHAKYYSEIPRDQFLGHVGLSAPANDSFSTAMPRDAYQKQFLANNPQADQSALDMALSQYDKDAAARAQAATAAPADRFKVLQSPEAMFDARLNAKLQGRRNGVVPQLPAKMQPDTVHTQTPNERLNEELRHELAVDRGEPVGPLTPSNVAPAEPGTASTFDTVAGNLVGGALNTLTGAGASLSRMVGANATADDWDAGRAQIAQRQHELGGDTMTGKVSGLVGGIAPALAVPADMVSQLVANAGLFAKPAFDDTLKAKLAEGYSQPLALAHAAEAFGLNLFAPTVAARGMGALAGKLGTAGLEGLRGAAAGLGQAAVEGAGFSVANSVMDKGTDVLAGQQNNSAWVNPEDMAVQALGFGALRAGHAIASGIAGHAEPLIPPTARVEDIAQAQTVDQAIAAAVESVPTINTEALRAGNDVNVADLLRSIRPLDPVPAPEPVAEPVAPELPAAADTISAPHDLVTTGEADAPATDLPAVDGLGRSPGDVGASVPGVDGGTGLARPDAGLPAADPARLAAADGLDLSGADRPADLQPPLSETAPAESAPLPPELAHGAAILSTMKPVEGMGQLQVVDPATMSGHEGSITPEHAQFVQALGDALGKKVVFFRQDGADKRLDGFAPRSAPDTLFVNVGKGDAAWHVVAGHEFFHQMPDDVRASFIATIKPMVSPEQFAALKQYINQPHLDESGHWEEIGADLFGNRFAEPGFFDKVLAQAKDRPAAAKVFAYVRSFLDKLSNAMAGKGFATDRYVADLDQIRAAAAEALGRYLKGAGAPLLPTNSLGKTASWVIRNKSTGEVIAETYDKSKVDALNTEKYEAVPVQQHLAEINDPASLAGKVARGEEIKAAADTPKEPILSGERDDAFNDLGRGFTTDGRNLLRDGKNVGDLKLEVVSEGKGPSHVVVRDLRVTSRGNGTGTEALHAIMDKASEQGMPVALTTESMLGKAHQQRLRAYYERLGFVKNRGADRVKGIGEEYVWTPDAAKLSSERDNDYMHAVQEGRKREALRILHDALGIEDKDATIDRGGAHTPSGPEDGSPLYDVSKNGTYPEDVYSHNGLRYYGTGEDKLDPQAYDIIKRMEGHPNMPVDIYRAVHKSEKGTILPGDWVTTVREYAKDHGEGALNGDYKIVKKMVMARDIFTSGDSWLEWGYHPQEFKPELPKGERKLSPLSERVAAWHARQESEGDAKLSTERDTRTIEVDGERRPITDSRGKLVAQDFEGQQAFYRWFADSKVVDADGRPEVVYHGTDTSDQFDSFAPGTFFTTHPSEASAYARPGDFGRRQRSTGKYRESTGAQHAGELAPYFGSISDIPRPEAGTIYATDNGVFRARGNGKWDVLSDLLVDYDHGDADHLRIVKGDASAEAKEIVDDYEDFIRRTLPGGDGGRVMPAYLSLKNPITLNAMEANRLGLRLGASRDDISAAIAKYERQGYDGIVTESDEASMFPDASHGLGGIPKQYIIFHPEQAKSAIGNNGDFDGTNPDIRYSQARDDSKLAKLIGWPQQMLRSAAFQPKMLVVPMTAGSEHAQAMAKEFASNNRQATAQWQAFDRTLTKHYSDDQLEAMWHAADQENDLRRDGKTSTTKGLASLPDRQREVVELLRAYGEQLWAKAKAAGMVEGDGVAFWTPRVAARIYADGSADNLKDAAGEFSKEARNLRTSASSTKHREYDTTNESEAALKEKFGDDAGYVKNIRVMPLAMAQLEKAVAGRTLINQIKAHGQVAGEELIGEDHRPNFVTFDHPAMRRFMPKMDWKAADMDKVQRQNYDVRADGVYTKGGDKLASYRITNGQVEQMQPVMDETGKPVMESRPLFVRKDFAGPLKAVFSTEPNKVYQGAMALKGGITSMIMISPLTHNLVIWGKALPSMVSTMGWKNNLKNLGTLGFRSYFVGNAARGNHALMNELIGAGLVPVSGRGLNPDIPAIAQGIEPGRSITAKVLGSAVGYVEPVTGPVAKVAGKAVGAVARPVGKAIGAVPFMRSMGDAIGKTGEFVENLGTDQGMRKNVDAAGHFWHETLLWDRVADMQAGMAVMLRAHLMDHGIDQYTANRVAAHFANRYGGMIPREAMSENAHMLLNLSLFSKSFTVTNLGAYKDLIGGLPSDVQAQIRLRAFEVQKTLGKSDADAETGSRKVLSKAQTATRTKAAAILALDIAAMATVTSLAQSMWQGQTGQQIRDDLKERAAKLGVKFHADPLAVIGHPLDALSSLSQTSDNPHGKEDRVRVGEDEQGNSYYMRLPVGKVGEELKAYSTLAGGLHLLHNKLSTFARPIADLMVNEDFTGKRIINPHDNAVQQVAKFAAYWVKSQLPLEDAGALAHVVKGDADLMDKAKLLGTATGLSVNKLAGGDVVAEMRYQNREQQAAIRDVLPEVREAMRRGDEDKARQLLEEAGQTPQEINHTLRSIDNPGKVSKQALRQFGRHASDDERERLDKMMAR